MASKCLERYSTSYVIRETQRKTATRCLYTPTGMAQVQDPTTPGAGEDVEPQGPPLGAGGNATRCSHSGDSAGFTQN